jgi:hypothetical protein
VKSIHYLICRDAKIVTDLNNSLRCSFSFFCFVFFSSSQSIGAVHKIFCCQMNSPRGSFSFSPFIFSLFFLIVLAVNWSGAENILLPTELSAWQFFLFPFYLFSRQYFCRGAQKRNYLRIVSGRFSQSSKLPLIFGCVIVLRFVAVQKLSIAYDLSAGTTSTFTIHHSIFGLQIPSGLCR